MLINPITNPKKNGRLANPYLFFSNTSKKLMYIKKIHAHVAAIIAAVINPLARKNLSTHSRYVEFIRITLD